MSTLYDHPDIYEERFTEKVNDAYKRHYSVMFENEQITDILDCSFGTGNLTFCLAELGYKISASDLSEPMLNRGKEKAVEKKIDMDFTLCDFRELSRHFNRKFSCVMSTGNSLVHVNNGDIAMTLAEMNNLVADNGYIYVDLRNWDRAMKLRERFQYGAPYYKEDGTRINYFQVWDYNTDLTVTINILQIYEKDSREIHREVYEETLFPVSRDFIISTLKSLGYDRVVVKSFPCFADTNVDDMNWYCLLAHKGSCTK